MYDINLTATITE